MSRKIYLVSVTAICVLVLAFGASTAGAQTGSEQGYDESGLLGSVDQGGGSEGGASEGAGSAPQVASASESSGGSLPFTGLDVGIVLLLGAAAVGTGLALRHVVRTQSQ